MNENFYPESEEILFTNRERELETLDFYLEEFLNGIKENVCIFRLRRTGNYSGKESAYELISKVIECGEESRRLIYQLTGGILSISFLLQREPNSSIEYTICQLI